jgi:hypothetical protein
MKNLIVFLASFILITPAFPQIKRDAVWCFGDSVLVDFNQSPPMLDYCATRNRGSACSIADSSGYLLFYAHSAYISFLPLYARGVVWNKYHQVMENGDSVYAENWYKEMVIIPDPGNHLRYYLFHTGVTLFSKLYYSVIDLSYNGGLGKVLQKNTLLDTLPGRVLTDGLSAIKHGNGRDWWVIFRARLEDGTTDNTIYRLLVTPDGISPLLTQQIGLHTSAGFLRLYFNHIGNKMLLINVAGLIEYYDFDRCTGELSNLITIHPENPFVPIETYFWSAEFSPNDEVLYVSTNRSASASYLYQYDLSSPAISTTKTLIDSLIPPGNGGDLKLAADGKIYWANAYYNGFTWPYPYPDSMYNQYNMYLSVINQPNVLGKATDVNRFLCDFQKYSFYLGGHRSYLGLPNNPNYDMIAKGASICDTLGLPNAVNEYERNKIFSIYPNPANEFIRLFYSGDKDSQMSVTLSDLTGLSILHKQLNSNMLELSAIPEGIYIITLFENKRFHSTAKLSVMK